MNYRIDTEKLKLFFALIASFPLNRTFLNGRFERVVRF